MTADPVPRYSPVLTCTDEMDMTPHAEGAWARWADFEELREENERLRRISAAADRLLNGIYEFADHGELKYLSERIQALDDALDRPADDVSPTQQEKNDGSKG